MRREGRKIKQSYECRPFVLINSSPNESGSFVLYWEHTQRTGLNSGGDTNTLTFSPVINGQVVNYFSLLGGLASHMPALY